MKKFSLSLLFAIMILAMFATAASATTPGGVNPDPTNKDGIQNQLMSSEKNAEVGKLTNANGTATGVDTNDGTKVDDVIKNVGGKTGQKTHTSYQNNTNSCASCHQTHTAKGDQLLFADGVYQTCSACHDGTLGFFNVFQDGSVTADTTKTMAGAGTFGGSHGASMHMANDAVKISAAPGGNKTGDGKEGTMWTESFNCASCHAPHGSYSDRLLQYNPNGIGAIPTTKGGLQLENVPVVTTTAGQTDAVILLRTDVSASNVTVAQYNKQADGSYLKSTAPWLYGYNDRTTSTSYWTRLDVDNDINAAYGSTKGVYFDYDQAQAYSTDVAGADALKLAVKGTIARPVVVKMAKDGSGNTVQTAYWTATGIASFSGKSKQQMLDLGYKVDASNKVSNTGVMMSKFCAACHTDYLQANADGKKSHFGDETAAYRHSTNSDTYTCVRCHYGHGTDAYIMKDSLGRTIKDLVGTTGVVNGTAVPATEADALGYIQDNNASSALKKFTNMSVCWACHNSSHAETIKNTERAAGHPIGMPTGY